MDNQENLQANFELPKPAADTTTNPGGAIEYGSFKEQNQTPGGGAGPSVATAQANAQAVIGMPVQGTASMGAGPVSTALSASDVDLIEKEWVLKAKEIVSRTHGDPFVQNKEINKMKADYIKKRYNKDIKQAGE